ncbi:MAG: recombinase family protein [Thermoanaerobaculia bacterium]
MSTRTSRHETVRMRRRAAIYARVSTQHQQRRGTIDSQVAELRARVVEDGHELVDEHILLDDGYSGSYLDRPGLDRLRDLACDRLIDLLYVHTPDRLARRYAHQVILIEELESFGCQVRFLDQAPSKDPEGQLLVQIQGVIAEYERAKFTERSRRGKLHRARQGVILTWKAPYGYRYVPRQDEEPGRWEIDEAEAQAVRSLFRWVAGEGISIRQATQRLNASPWKTRAGSDLWNCSTVGGMLTNEAYIGTAYYNRRRWIESGRTDAVFRRSKKTRSIPRPREQWVSIAIPALIERQTFARVQEQLKRNKAFSRRNLRREGEYLLRCLVSCGVCGRSMVAHSHGRHTYYHCSGSVDHVATGRPRRCPAPQVYAPDLDQRVWQEIETLLLAPQRIRESWQRQHGASGQQATDVVEAELVRLDGHIADARRQVQRLLDGYQKGLLNATETSRRRARLDEKLAHWSTERSRLEAQRPRWREIEHAWGSLERFTQGIAASLATLPFEERQKLIRKIVERIWITAWQVKIKLAIPLSTNGDLTPQRAHHPQAPAPLLPPSSTAARQTLPGCMGDGSGAHRRGRRGRCAARHGRCHPHRSFRPAIPLSRSPR